MTQYHFWTQDGTVAPDLVSCGLTRHFAHKWCHCQPMGTCLGTVVGVFRNVWGRNGKESVKIDDGKWKQPGEHLRSAEAAGGASAVKNVSCLWIMCMLKSWVRMFLCDSSAMNPTVTIRSSILTSSVAPVLPPDLMPLQLGASGDAAPTT